MWETPTDGTFLAVPKHTTLPNFANRNLRTHDKTKYFTILYIPIQIFTKRNKEDTCKGQNLKDTLNYLAIIIGIIDT